MAFKKGDKVYCKLKCGEKVAYPGKITKTKDKSVFITYDGDSKDDNVWILPQDVPYRVFDYDVVEKAQFPKCKKTGGTIVDWDYFGGKKRPQITNKDEFFVNDIILCRVQTDVDALFEGEVVEKMDSDTSHRYHIKYQDGSYQWVEAHQVSDKLNKYKTEMTKLVRNAATSEAARRDAEQRRDRTEQTMATMRTEITRTTAELAEKTRELEKQRAEWEKKLSDVEKERQEEKTKADKRVENAEKQIKQLEKELADAENTMKEQSNRITMLQSEKEANAQTTANGQRAMEERPRQQKRKAEQNGRASGVRPPKVTKPEAPAENPRLKVNEKGHLVFNENDVIKNGESEYVYVKYLGKGGFGRVTAVINMTGPNRRTKALKVVRPKHSADAEKEIELLEKINNLDPQEQHPIVHLRDHFVYDKFTCLLFDCFGQSIYDFKRQGAYNLDVNPFTFKQSRFIAYQLCHAIEFLHRNKISHTDLKPENILFRDSTFTVKAEGQKLRHDIHDASIVIIDLGLARHDDEDHTEIVGTLPYQAPEMILELGWEKSADVWSIGCILLELYVGHNNFHSVECIEVLARMEAILGSFPSHMIKNTKTPYFDKGKVSFNGKMKKEVQPLKKYNTKQSEPNHNHLFDLIGAMLQLNPDKRITLAEALKHPYFKQLTNQEKELVKNGPRRANQRAPKSSSPASSG